VRKELRKEHSCPHIKLLLLFYPDRLRVGILTGNMIEYDWSTLENAAFLQDFPILPGERRDTSTDVYDQLSMVLSSMGLPRQHAAFQLLARYDLTRGPTIVASLATDVPVKGWDKISKVGMGRLAVKSRELMGGAAVAGGLELEAQVSTLPGGVTVTSRL
jgi:tyrosyl-DNA phosphodiesterase-1